MATFGSATLVLNGPKGTTTVEMTGARVVLGREPENGIVVDDAAVSHAHCELVKEQDTLTIRDLGSSNGTYVNGRKVVSSPLFDGDHVHIGQSQGTIAVRQANGKPLHPPTERSSASTILTVLALLLIAGSGVVFWLIRQRMQEHAKFARFEQQVQSFLQQKSPCEVVASGIDRLGTGADLVVPTIDPPPDKHQKAPAPNLDPYKALLTRTTDREKQVRALADALDNGPEARQRQDEVRDLLANPPTFRDPRLSAAVSAVKGVIEGQAGIVVTFKQGLEDYASQLKKFNDQLQAVAKGDVHEASTIGKPPDGTAPARLQQSCEKDFSSATSQAFEKLAETPL